jgi:cytochrome c553
MQIRVPLMAAVLVVFAASLATISAEGKIATKDVMDKCMKGGLCKKVADGKASKDEKTTLLENFTSLSENKPPKGDADSWKTKCSALVAAAKAAVADDAGYGDKLKAAANCKACHEVHKGK